MKNKITFLLIGLLVSASFPTTGRTENVCLKIPQRFYEPESYFLVSYNEPPETTVLIIPEKVSKNEPSKLDIYMEESFESLIGSLVCEIPCGLFLLQALGGLVTEDYCRVDVFVILGLVAHGIGAPIGSSVGTVLTGKRLKQNGSFGKTFLGSITVGTAYAALGTIPGIIKKDKGVALIGASIGWEIGCVLGSVKGYNK